MTLKNLNCSLFLMACLFYQGMLFSQKQDQINYIDSLTDVARKNIIYNHKLLSKVIKLSKTENYPKGQARGLLNLGVYYMNTNKVDSALYQFDLCSQLIQNHEELEFVNGYVFNNKATILINKGFFNQALEQYHKAYELNLKFENHRATMISKIHMNECYVKLDQSDKALDMFNEIKNDSLFYDKKENAVLRYKLFTHTALAHYGEKEYRQALIFWKKSFTIAKSFNDPKTLSYVYISMSDSYMRLKEYENALKNAQTAQILIKNEEGAKKHRTINNKIIGMIYNEMGDYKNSISYFQKIIQSKQDNQLTVAKAYGFLGNNYSGLKNWKASADYYQKYGSLMSSLYKSRGKDIATFYDADLKLVEEKHQNDLLQLDNELLISKNEIQRFYITSLSVGFLSILLLIISIILYKKNDQASKKVEFLEKNEKKILENHIKSKEEEFTTTITSVNERLDKLASIKEYLSSAVKYDNKKEILEAEKKLDQFLASTSGLTILKDRIESKYPDLTSQIKSIYPHLSANDIRHCLLLKLNLSLKESGQLLNVSTHAVKMGRKRVKKKINIPEDLSLKEHLNTILS